MRYRIRHVLLSMAAGLVVILALAKHGRGGGEAPAIDTALVLAVDISDSVDEGRYRLQMEGIARALEDESVIQAITGGANGAILICLVSWADRAELQMPWRLVRNASEARLVADAIRNLPQRTGEYTCVARMMDMIRESVISNVPTRAIRTVVDVSGDGIDNCARPTMTDAARDALLEEGVTINGLPILVAGENDVVGSGAYRAPGFALNGELIGPGMGQTTLDAWYRHHIIGGPGAFLLTAQGFEDFGRAFRQKFVTEISSNFSAVFR